MKSSSQYFEFINTIYLSVRRENGTTMLSFELSAIDLILVLSVIVLLLLYLTKLSKVNEKEVVTEATVESKGFERKKTISQSKYAACPRGFGNIKMVSDDGSVSERCLGCYRIMECYSGDNGEATGRYSTVSR